jgi:hypothetical protein
LSAILSRDHVTFRWDGDGDVFQSLGIVPVISDLKKEYMVKIGEFHL